MRRKYVMIGLTIVISAVLWTSTLSKKKEVSYMPDTVVMRVGDCEITVSEFMIPMLECREQIESKWGKEMWSAETGTDEEGNRITYEEDVKKDIMEQVKVTKTLFMEAKEKGIRLTRAEQAECEKKAESEIRKFNSEDLITYEITAEEVCDYYKERKMAERMYDTILKGFQPKKKLEDYKRVTIYGMLFSTTKNGEDGKPISVNEKKIKEQKENAYKAREKVLSGTDMDALAKEYHLEYAGERTLDPYGLAKKYRQTIEALEDGECSPVIETTEGYLLIKMIKKDNKKEAMQAMEEDIKKQKKEKFDKYYQKEYKKRYKVKMEEDVFGVLPLASKKDES